MNEIDSNDKAKLKILILHEIVAPLIIVCTRILRVSINKTNGVEIDFLNG